MPKLSSAVEQRLLTAVEKAAEYSDAGCDPDTAMVKSARECSIRQDELPLVVRAYNVAQSAVARQNDNLFDRAADFPLADVEKIAAQLFPATVKTASSLHHSTAISDDYKHSPATILQRRKAAGHVKVARNVVIGGGLPTDPAMAYARNRASVEIANTALEESRRKWASAVQASAETVSQFANAFRDYRSPGWAEVSKVARLWYRDDGDKLMQVVQTHYPSAYKTAQMAKPGASDTVTSPIYRLLKQAMAQLLSAGEAAQEYQASQVKYAQVVHNFVNPMIAEDRRSIVPVDAADLRKHAGTMSTVATSVGLSQALPTAFQSLKNTMAPPVESEVQSIYDDITSPEHESMLRSINVEPMLQDVMLNDPVISGYDPADVADAFNEVVRLAPHAVDQRLLMLPMLRKRLTQGHLDQFEADQLLGSEAKLRGMSNVSNENAMRPKGVM